MAAFQGAFPLLGGLSLRFPQLSDDAFLLELFIASRPWLKLAHPDPDYVRTMYEQQYKAMRLGQEDRYPQHLDFIVERTGQAVGRLIVDLGYHDWRVSELEIHEQARGKNIGSDVMRSLQKAAEKPMMPITLSVLMVSEKAQRFYARLGFLLVGETPPMLELIWFPPGHPARAALRTASAAAGA